VHVPRRVVVLRSFLTFVAAGLALGCGSLDPEALPQARELRINEVVSDNEGVFIDELGETDDYVELYNASDRTLRLSDYVIVNKKDHALPPIELAPGAVQLLWADGSPEQGPLHLPFKLSSSGESLVLVRHDGYEVDRVLVPPLEQHHAFARQPDGDGPFRDCGWASPGRNNGSSCGPRPAPPPPDDLTFADFDWPPDFPGLSTPLAIVEAALEPGGFVEIVNASEKPVDLASFELTLAGHRIGAAWPGYPVPAGGSLLDMAGAELAAVVTLRLPEERLAAGGRVLVPISESELSGVNADPKFEGVLTLGLREPHTAVDRVEFSSWPPGAVLARPEPSGGFRFCRERTPGEPNTTCDPLLSREVSDYEWRILTPGDLSALAAGRAGVGVEPVEFLIDMAFGDDAVVFLNSANYDLHYTFVRHAIQGLPRLDRCIPAERDEFNRGWVAFSEENYYRVEGRRFLLGTLARHAGSGLSTVEFSPGDVISAEQMQRAFFAVTRRLPDPEAWSVRPQTTDQIERIRAAEGRLPIVGPKAPFRGVTFQSLTPAVAFGTLRYVAADQLRQTPLGPRDIVVTNEVPNDIPLIGGLVTEAFQTPLAHVNVLSRGRNTPNMALVDARHDPRLKPFFGRLVKLEVTGSSFHVSDAVPEEALAFWESRLPDSVLVPRLDASLRGIAALEEYGIDDIPRVGGKAAQLAELLRVPLCTEAPVTVPERPFAIPLIHSLEHYQASGALALLHELQQSPAFLADPIARAAGLGRVRSRVLARRVEPALLAEVHSAIRTRWPNRAVRFRSSSNTEDLPGFSGAGLYTSEGVDAEDVPTGAERAILEVWASLWEQRAYDEREYSGVDQGSVAMAVLVHPAYRSERVNGVAISRDALQPTRGDRYYVNAQLGEALVTNPAPGIESDEFTYELYRFPRMVYHSHSSFSPDRGVISESEAGVLACNLYRIHEHFRPFLDPERKNSWFAMDIEWKLMGEARTLAIKQARSYSFGEDTPTGVCDF
jgi:hypothetical protein